MAERLRLTRTLGVAGWQVCDADGDSLLLAALGVCLLRPAGTFTLRGLWRIARRWRSGFGAAEAAALRLALCVHEQVRIADIRIRVAVALPDGEPRAPRPFRLTLRRLRRGARLTAAPADCVWTVLRLAAGSERTLARLTAALAIAPKGAQLQIEIEAQRAAAPDTLRARFPLRVEGQFDAQEGWFPLIRESQIDIAGENGWTHSTSRN